MRDEVKFIRQQECNAGHNEQEENASEYGRASASFSFMTSSKCVLPVVIEECVGLFGGIGRCEGQLHVRAHRSAAFSLLHLDQDWFVC